MNIFILDSDPVKSAQMQCDKHVIKMVLESAQMLSTVSHYYGGIAPYKPTHAHHPCVVWVRSTQPNWSWFVNHSKALAKEYTFRYGRIHKSEAVINNLASNGAHPTGGDTTDFALCMPDEFKVSDDSVHCYRLYYARDKSHFARWDKGRRQPHWWIS